MLRLLGIVLSACPSPAPVAVEHALLETATPRPIPRPEAATLNHDGSGLYREKKFAAAEAKYRAALTADPEFLTPHLNLACALMRRDRIAEAAAESARLVTLAYVPWVRTLDEATDLIELRLRPEYQVVRAAVAAAALSWGRAAGGGFLIVARVGEPLAVTVGTGGTAIDARLNDQVFVLGPKQEIFSWLPAHGRFMQVTAEDGRVIGFARSPDGQQVLYLRAEKVVRRAGAPARLRGASARLLHLPTMRLGAPLSLTGDLEAVDLGFDGRGLAWLRARDAVSGRGFFLRGDQMIETARWRPPRSGSRTTILGSGVAPATARTRDPNCGFGAIDTNPRTRLGKERVEIRPRQGKPFVLQTPHGAGLFGLPLFDLAP